MNPWQTFLSTQGAHFMSDAHCNMHYCAHFGNPTAELEAAQTEDIITELSHLGLLEVSGEDAKTFLQDQLTNDVMQLNGSNAQFAGYCSPKGRLLALFLAFAHQDHLHLQFERELMEPILKRLKMYVLRAKVTIKDVSDEIIRIGVAGAGVEAKLTQLFEQVPQLPNTLITLEKATIIKLMGEYPRYEIFTSATHAHDIWQTLQSNTKPVGKTVWDHLEINAGLPNITQGTQEAFVPQMINLDALNGINFKKGCYTGQEIVARTHYLGKVKRRTLLAHVNAQKSPVSGDVVTTADDTEVGQIVRVSPAPNGGFDALIEVRLESKAAGEIFWQKHPVTFKDMPYQIAE